MPRMLVKMSLLAASALLLFAGTALANEKCTACHADVSAKHKTTVHGKLGKDCASCHGGGDAHMASPSKKNIVRFGKGADAKTANAQCQSCHGKNQKLMFWDSSYHKKNDVTCASCHSVAIPMKPTKKTDMKATGVPL